MRDWTAELVEIDRRIPELEEQLADARKTLQDRPAPNASVTASDET